MIEVVIYERLKRIVVKQLGVKDEDAESIATVQDAVDYLKDLGVDRGRNGVSHSHSHSDKGLKKTGYIPPCY